MAMNTSLVHRNTLSGGSGRLCGLTDRQSQVPRFAVQAPIALHSSIDDSPCSSGTSHSTRNMAARPSSHAQHSSVSSKMVDPAILSQPQPTYIVVSSRTHLQSTDASDASGSGEEAIKMLSQKNTATATLVEVRTARVEALMATLTSKGLSVPSAVAEAAVDTSFQLLEEANIAGSSMPTSYHTLVQQNQALMRVCRALNVQIMALEAELNKAGLPLPKRTLSSASFSSYSSASSCSTTGTLGEEELPAATAAAALLSADKTMQACKHTVQCHFNIHCPTKPGERVLLVGSHPSLGSWDEHGALPLHWSDGHIWQGTLSLDWPDYNPQIVSFKAVKQYANGQLEWQAGRNRDVILGPHMGHHVTPCIASMDFTGPDVSDGRPLNFQEACAASYHNNFDTDWPEAYARRRAEQDVEQSINRLREELAGGGCQHQLHEPRWC